MKLVVGLGNPGTKYETTRHNVGFLVIDYLADEWKAMGPIKKNQAEVFEATVAGEKVLLVKPQTYMNLSGRSVAPIFNFYKCRPEDLVVVYDDIDLPPMALRTKAGGGSGGHNGIKSLDQELGSDQQNYFRLRVGVGRPADPRISPADYVLSQYSDEELEELPSVFEKVKGAVELLLRGDMVGAQNKFNRSGS